MLLCKLGSVPAQGDNARFLRASEFDKLDAARDEILAQLDSVRRGEITDDELRSAKKSVASDLRAVQDSIGELEGFYLSQALDGLDYGPAELAALAEDVTKEDVQAIAESIECDLIYFLQGKRRGGRQR